MSKLLLLVQNETHVAHLDAAAKAILASSIRGVWLVFSPAVLVNTSEAAATLDAEIAQLTSAERAAADRGDYTAASGYKTQREGKVLDRAKEIRDAHKKLTSEQRAARTKELFAPFHAQLQAGGRNAKISSHSDHYDPEQWVAMLNSLSGVWFKEFSPGSFMVGWPESVETAIKESTAAYFERVSKAGYTATEVNQTFSKTPDLAEAERRKTGAPIPEVAHRVSKDLGGTSPKPTRREELEATHHMSLRPLAKKLGIDIAGKDTEKLIDAILAAEAALATTPEPAAAELAGY